MLSGNGKRNLLRRYTMYWTGWSTGSMNSITWDTNRKWMNRSGRLKTTMTWSLPSKGEPPLNGIPTICLIFWITISIGWKESVPICFRLSRMPVPESGRKWIRNLSSKRSGRWSYLSGIVRRGLPDWHSSVSRCKNFWYVCFMKKIRKMYLPNNVWLILISIIYYCMVSGLIIFICLSLMRLWLNRDCWTG